MKKYLMILMTLVLTTSIFAAENVIPKDIQQRIRTYAIDNTDSGDGGKRSDFIRWQEKAYLYVEQELAVSGISESDQKAVRDRLNAMYGPNYAKQTKEVKDEIKYYTVVKKAENEKQQAAIRNAQSSEELKEIIADPQVPEKYMNHFISESQRLYPDNPYEQKRYIESSVNTYKTFNR